MKDLSKSRVSLVGLLAVVALLIVGGAVFAFMQAAKDTKPAVTDQAAVTVEPAAPVTAEELEADVIGIGERIEHTKELTEASKKAVEDEKYQIKVGN